MPGRKIVDAASTIRYNPAIPQGEPAMNFTELSLNDTLANLGLTTKPATCEFNIYSKEIRRNGVTLFVGDAREVWTWLRAKGLVK